MKHISSRFTLHVSRSQRGVALLIVLSSLMLLSALVIEFAFDTNVTYNISMNERDRLQAYYLAQSALNFSKIVIKYNKEAQQMAQQAAQKLGKPINIQPLYKMIPINSGILRTLVQGQTGAEGAEAELPAAEGGGDSDKLDTARKAVSAFSAKQAESFLSFEGDFNAEVEAEDGKLPLNAFFKMTPTQPEYDRLKNVLISLLQQKPFEGLLKDRIKDSQDLANKIVDYIDPNESINELGGSERGPESGQYSGTSLKPKNAKLLTVEELIMVPGLNDDVLTQLKKYVTVYKSTDKINACLASDELVRAMIVAFTQKRDDMEPLRPENEDRLKSAVESVLAKCPDVNAMALALNESLGITPAASGTTTQPSGSSSTTQPSASTGSSAGSTSFSNMITNDEKIYKIESMGTVGNAEVKIIDVVNASSSNPDQWKDLYWRVE